jgi:hypothetical protein
LEQGTDINEDVLQTEVKMNINGITPSVFFRFPGLVRENIITKKWLLLDLKETVAETEDNRPQK